MAQVFGVYFGNSSASIALCKEDGKVEILANDAGDRVTPTVVKITSKEQVVGIAAVNSLSSRAASTVTRNKTFLDHDLSPDKAERFAGALGVRTESDAHARTTTYLLSDEEKTLKYTPNQVAAIILKKLYNIGAASVPGQKELGCVVCVPRHWSDSSKGDVVKAAEDAGWKVLQILSEAPAAALAYRLDTHVDAADVNVLVLRVGGVSCNATAMRFDKGFMTVLSDVFCDDIGGQDLVAVLKKHLADEFRKKYHLDPTESRKSMAKLGLAAEAMFQVLSTLPSCTKFVESVCEGVDFSVNMSRARLEALVSPLLPAIARPVNDALAQAKLQPSDISKVVLAGAPLKMPRLVSYVSALFPEGAQVLHGLSPDEVMATGAAYQAGYIASSPAITDQIKETTFKLPYIDSPIVIKFDGCDEGLTLEDVVVPCRHSVSVPIQDSVLGVKAVQNIQGGASVNGECSLGDFKAPTVLQVNVKVTLQNELLIEAVDTQTKETKRASVMLRDY